MGMIFKGKARMARGLKNCNPGNIRRSATRYKGEVHPSRDLDFKEFSSLPWGYRAVFVLLHTYRVRYGLQSVEEMITRWAPPSENRTGQYVRYVAEAVGVAPGDAIETLDEGAMLSFAAAVSEVENGEPACMEEVRAGWRLFLSDFGKEIASSRCSPQGR